MLWIHFNAMIKKMITMKQLMLQLTIIVMMILSVIDDNDDEVGHDSTPFAEYRSKHAILIAFITFLHQR